MKWWNNMRKIFFTLLAMLMAVFTCVHANSPVDNTSSSLIQLLNLPTTARVAAESNNLIVFANVDSTYNEMDVVTLWTYKPKNKTLLKLLTTNPGSDYECLGYENKAQRVSFTSIPTISRASRFLLAPSHRIARGHLSGAAGRCIFYNLGAIRRPSAALIHGDRHSSPRGLD